MNKTISLAAIAMVAVVMGMSAFAPAMAEKPTEVEVCHFDDDGSISIITVNTNAVKAHTGGPNHDGHDGDYLITEDTADCPVRDVPV